MKQKMREISLILATGATAVACSQFMQHAEWILAQFGVSSADAAVPHVARPVSDGHLVSALGTRRVLAAVPERAVLADSPVPQLPQDRIYTASFTGEDAPQLLAQAEPPAPACAAPDLSLQPAENGMVAVSYTDRCNAGAVATLTQPGLQFDVKLDAQGHWSGLVPAMIANMRMLAASAGGVASAGISQPEAAEWNRVVLSWAQPVAMHISDSDQSQTAAPAGYVTRFSAVQDGQQAEVYSTRKPLSDTQLVVDAPLTAENCGQDLSGGVAWADQSKLHPLMPVTLMMPDCDQQGGSVMMELPDLTAAEQ